MGVVEVREGVMGGITQGLLGHIESLEFYSKKSEGRLLRGLKRRKNKMGSPVRKQETNKEVAELRDGSSGDHRVIQQ